MARALSALALAALVAFGAACGKPAAPESRVRLQVFGDPLEIAAYRALVAAYEAKHPGARVELIPVGQQRDHMAKLATAFAAGDAPELFVVNFRRFGQFAAKGVLAPLGPQMAASGQWIEADFHAPAVEAFRYEGQLTCLPQNASSLVVYYNRALFRAAGIAYPKPDWTMNDFLAAALNVRSRARDAAGQRVYGVGFEPTLIRIAPFIWAFGGRFVDDVDKPTRFELDRNALLALQQVKALAFDLAPPLAAYKAEDHDARFARGGLGMLLQSRRYTATLRATKNLDWDVAPFPRVRAPVSVLHADAYCQSASAQDPAAAQRFVAFALSDEGQSLLARSGRSVPSRIATSQGPAFLDPTQAPASARVFLDAIPQLRRTPNVASWHEVESKADVLLEEWFYEAPPAGEREGGESLREQVLFARRLRDAVQPALAPPQE
ncbi:MAG TPA: sugar ABC transporter substrate-binding protein [Verrucomicrobiae bacterium]|nr:sugar ABC transporter substrate-binding protein [Verrucomicrobiae bacterium]